MGNKWKTSFLTDHYIISSGLSKPAKDFGTGYPFLSFKDIFYNYFLPDSLTQLVQSTEKERVTCSVKRGDVFLTRTSETMHELGMSSVALKDYANATFNGFCKRLRPKEKSELEPEYVGYYLRSPLFRQNMLAFSTMSTRASLNNEMISRLEISYPDRNIQKKIANILLSLDKKTAILKTINQTLEEMSQTLFKSWFVDFDPVIDNALDAGNPIPEALQSRAELRQKVRNSTDFKPLPAEIRSLFPSEFEETELGWVPKGWQIKSLDHIANFQNGLALQKFRPKNMEDDYLPVLKIADLRAGQITNDERARTDISDSCKVYDGDMIFSWSGTLMIDIWTGGNAALNQHLYKVTSKKYPQSFYFMWTIQHLSRFQHIAEAKAVTMGHIKKGDLSNSFCLIPTSSLITKYDNIVGGYLAKIKNQRLLNNQMTALRDTLLPKLISGELSLDDIPDLTTDTEAA
ncbi:TPA: restriction endonuclease subunit S [Escherichia coli]|uniref:restriction endonuclease subunit S n=1 Tax=Escherichia coli TaxID=562 RepID=UPI00028E2685|nr:restriction endonuclease subunit S [Escherichia coli]MED7449861.1 restriction endonuclease subunit S [Escherichia coli O157]EFK3338511.1 restriction endonuclease subunit S [Escherichia coli]EFO1405961.1 restriction endonuclease subunit S [Escherichia coli]EHL6072153.1 restriction endonuclease subunit S [Escherichia coli]EIF0906716.1 restriction endonuclease subunit S [Escherichia coli]